MSKTEAASPSGQALIQMAINLAGDGELTAAKILHFRDWLKAQSSDIPAIAR